MNTEGIRLAQEFKIRNYKPEDRNSIRKVACDTAFLGKSCCIFFDGKEIISDFLTSYFTDYEPESCFVTEIGGQVVGYLLGARDSAVLERVFPRKIFPRILFRTVSGGALFKSKNIFFLLRVFKSFLKGEFRTPNFSKNYPATLHINIDAHYRNAGIGSRLIAAFLDYLVKNKVRGVHLATMSATSAVFFSKQGFNLLFEGRRTYFGNLLNGGYVPLYIYGRELA